MRCATCRRTGRRAVPGLQAWLAKHASTMLLPMSRAAHQPCWLWVALQCPALPSRLCLVHVILTSRWCIAVAGRWSAGFHSNNLCAEWPSLPPSLPACLQEIAPFLRVLGSYPMDTEL